MNTQQSTGLGTEWGQNSGSCPRPHELLYQLEGQLKVQWKAVCELPQVKVSLSN